MAAQLRPKGDERVTGVSRGTQSVDTEDVLAALEDPDCRSLLEATAAEPLTAAELIDRCEIPRSTTYRKIERLTEAGLLEERIRLSADGKHASEYRRTFEDVTISISESDGVTVGLSAETETEATD